MFKIQPHEFHKAVQFIFRLCSYTPNIARPIFDTKPLFMSSINIQFIFHLR